MSGVSFTAIAGILSRYWKYSGALNYVIEVRLINAVNWRSAEIGSASLSSAIAGEFLFYGRTNSAYG